MHVPAGLSEEPSSALVPSDVPLELALPELDVCRGRCGKRTAGMPMPKTSVHKNDGSYAVEGDVWPTAKISGIAAILDVQFIQIRSYQKLRFCS
jgi:hypothetical protein